MRLASLTRGLLAAVLLGLAMAAAAQTASDPVARLRTTMIAVCAPEDSDATTLAARIGDAELIDEQVHRRGDARLGWTRRYRLGDGAELVLIRRDAAGRLIRFSADHFERDKGGALRPVATATADRTCGIIQGRRIHYDPDGRQASLELFGAGLRSTGQVDPLNPSVPTGTDPGGVSVALFDSGLAYTLPEFSARLARDKSGKALGYDYWDLDDRPFDSNPSRSPFFPIRHGTPVASVLLREAPKTRLFPYRFPRPDMSRMAGMVAAADSHGVIVVSMPMGSRDPADWNAFADAARTRPHMLFVVSAGNDDRDIDREPIYPAVLDLENILVVTSATPFGRLAPGSNWGRRSVDLMVPAERIEVIDYRGAAGKASGSSYAVPRVAALAARLLADNPDWKAPELKAAILDRAAPSPYEPEPRLRHGWIANPAD